MCKGQGVGKRSATPESGGGAGQGSGRGGYTVCGLRRCRTARGMRKGLSVGQSGQYLRGGWKTNGVFQAGEFHDWTGFPRKRSLATI